MDGNTRYELAPVSPDSNFPGNYQNGQRGYSAPTLGRSSSFREGSESRGVGSGNVISRASTASIKDAPILSQCLMLEPIVMGDPKYARPVDLRRLLNFSVGSILEENAFGAAHLKNSPPMAVEELKRLRKSVADTCHKASGRAKKLDDHLNKLNKFVESVLSKKQQQQRNEMLTNDRPSGAPVKIGSQMHRSTAELGSQKLDDRPKNLGLNKRLRTTVSETRAECRSNGAMRHSLMVTKERDLLKDNNPESDVVEEKIRRLPPGGEGWEKKMKRKRSVGAVFARSIDNDGEMKRNVHQKLTVEASLQSSDTNHGFRSGASGGINKLDPMPSPVGLTTRINFKNEQEKCMLSRDVSGGPIKERALGKVNVKLNNREDNNAMGSNPVIKGKASRALRSGSMAAASSAASVLHVPGTLESWEQPLGVSRTPSAGGLSNRKRSLPSVSSSPPITQWGGQRQQKMSRTRRTNLIPVSNHDEVLIQSDGCPSDFGPRISIGGINSSFLPKSTANGNQNFKAKSENAPSPARLSESEESGAGEPRINDKGVSSREIEEKTANAGVQNVVPSAIPIKKNKIVLKEENGDGVRRQGRNGRVSPYSRASISPTSEKLDNTEPSKPIRNVRSGSDKSGSKSGRPSKKLSDRKGFSRLGHVANGGSPDCSGESDDDREELFTAAKLACYSSFNACSNAFWKTFEALFASVDLDERSFLSEQLKLSEESLASVCQNSINDNSFEVELDNNHHEVATCTTNNSHIRDSVDQFEFVEQFQCSSLYGGSDLGKNIRSVPFFQRVLSALIIDDETDEYDQTGFGRQRRSAYDSCPLPRTECKLGDGLGFINAVYGSQTQKNGKAHNILPCNGSMDVDRSSGALDHICNGELKQRESGYKHSEYEQRLQEQIVLELESIDLHMEDMPALDDKEDGISDEIAQLQRRLNEKIGRKRICLDKLCSVIQKEKKIERDLDQVALDRLVELAYKKLLATKRSYASKHGIPKVSKQVAQGFVKRTLARCIKFADSQESCFSEPSCRDILYAAPPQFAETELLSGVNPTIANDANSLQSSQSDMAVAKMGPMSNRGKKKEVLLDDVGGGAAFRASSALGTLGGAKGKRSERDRDRFPKAGRLSMGGSKGERKAKSKPKQKTAQLSTSGNAFVDKSRDTNSAHPTGPGSANSKRKDVRFMSSANGSSAASRDVKEVTDLANLPLGNIDELDVDAEIGAPHDINSWFNFEVDGDGLQDHNAAGLDIPMDDLSELNMF